MFVFEKSNVHMKVRRKHLIEDNLGKLLQMRYGVVVGK